jgi:hypothetical protein
VSRASDDTREQAVGVLRKGLLTGRLGTDTFVQRVDAAYRARTHDELERVTEDLPRHRSLFHALLDRLAPSPPCLAPPEMRAGERRVLGRDNACDYALADPTVSSRHAELICLADGWLIRDLGSKNGTRVNGWLAKEQRLRAGDTLTLGRTTVVFQPLSPGSPE